MPAVEAPPAQAAAPQQPQRASHVRVGLKLPFKPPAGQSVGVVGSAELLGAWNPDHALKLFPNASNDVWQIDFLVDPRCGTCFFSPLGAGRAPHARYSRAPSLTAGDGPEDRLPFV